MEVRRTVPVKLEVTERDAALLRDTIDQFRDAAKNIGFELLRSLHKPSGGDAPVGVRIKHRGAEHERVHPRPDFG